MAKFIVIEGRVVGGHHISDLGIDVPYGEEIPINYDRASWSRDLNQAIQSGQVSKKKVVSQQEMRSPRRGSPKPAKSPEKPPKKKPAASKEPKRVEPGGAEDVDREALLKAKTEANEKLREMNEALLETTGQLFDQQKALMAKMAELLERPAHVEGLEDLKEAISSLKQNGVSSSSGSAPETSGSEDSQDVPTFIPSKIRSGRAKAGGSEEVQSERKTKSSKFSDAASALKAMRDQQKKEEDDDPES